MAGAVSKIIYENLCENEGCLEFGKCKEVLRNRRITVDHSVLLKTVSDNGKFAVSLAKDINSGTLVVAKTQLRVCQKVQGECLQCNHLHLCRYFICGNCKYGNKCKYSHDLASTHNLAILIEAGLNNLTGKELFPLLLQNDAYLLPEICSHYNRGPGQHGICKFPNSCIHLHVCQHFLQGDCKFGEKCRREHSFNDQVLKILKGRGLSDDKEILGKLYRCKSIIKQPPPNLENLLAHPEVTENLSIRSLRKRSTTSDTSAAPPTSEADRNEICLYFLRRQCRFKDKCSQVHYQLPYRWQVVQDSISWIDMPNMEETERAYCDPNNAFKHLGGTVQRLSTVSSVSKPHDLTLTTDWLWFWEDDDGSWVEYGMDKVGEAGGITASVNSGTLERVYLSEKEMDCFSAGGCNYIIDFKEMRQQKVKSGAQREVRRRPRFVSTQEVQDKLRG
ncbi:protein mono-ADP-ribosyltransferase PARP12-like [Gadus chalcogrammus]|uniref:protein mono-ADP-ribosyltransferase PARP12-like n=1 Tax=Gadus chalcogrammus TaxID=1042646 RepID=UPI0024C4BDA7|nr:protein mono-ADP-ribosyltransferase PARP12-like [Gadus chalcogrammus]